ncbi:MAG: hypothetical protein ACE5I2_05920 [Anaerolineae bacterium]
MTYQKGLFLTIRLMLVTLSLVACGAPTATQAIPTPKPEVASTPVPTEKSVPPTPTLTPVLPSPTPVPPTPTFAPTTWLLQGQIIGDFTSVCDLDRPELQPQDVGATYAPGAQLSWVGCETLDEELQSPLAVIIKVQNSTDLNHTLMIPLPLDVIVHTQAGSKPAAAFYHQGWVEGRDVKLETEVKPGSAVELLYLIPRFSSEATIDLGDIGSFKIEAPMPPTTASSFAGITISGLITNFEDAEQYLAEDSYLQLVRIPDDGKLSGTTDDQGRLVYDSDLAQISIPRDGAFTFQIESLEPGNYLIAVQLLRDTAALGGGPNPLLVKEEEEKYVRFEIPQDLNLPLSIDLGEVIILGVED